MTRFQPALFFLVSLTLPTVVTAEGTLFYDAPTGEVFFELDVPEDRFITFDIRSDSGRLQPENFIRLGEPTILFFTTEDYIADNAGLGTFKREGLYGLGAIYPSNVSEADFLADVTSTWGAEGSTQVVPFEIAFSKPTGVPRNDPSLPSLDELWATSAELIYDATNGNVTVDTPGYISAIALTNDAGGFLTPTLSWADSNFSTIMGAETVFVAGLMEPGTYKMESLLPAGLSRTELIETFSTASFVGAAGVGGTQFDFSAGSIAMAIVHVPEPQSWIGTLVAFVVCSAARSRRLLNG